MTKNSVLATSLPSWNLAVSFSKSISFYISGILCVGMVLAPAPPSSFPECGCPQWNEIYWFGDRTISLKGNPLDRPHIVDHKQNEFFPIFKERTLSFLPSHFKTENMFCFWNIHTCYSSTGRQVLLTCPKESATQMLKQIRNWWAASPLQPAVPRHLAPFVRCSGNASP